MVPKDYTEHLTEWNVRLNFFKQQRALWTDKQLYVQVVAPTDSTCVYFRCVIIHNLFDDQITRAVVVLIRPILFTPEWSRWTDVAS